MWVTFWALLVGALRDRISLFWSIIFPVGLLVGLGIAFPAPAYRQQLAAGTVALSALFFSLNGIAFEALNQRNRGVYKLLRATPFRTWAFICSLTAARSLVALASIAGVLIAGALLFGVTLPWRSLLPLVPALSLAILCFTFLGMFVGNLAQREEQVNIIANLIEIPILFASEAFYSLADAPGWLKAMSHYLPLDYLLHAVRAALAGEEAGAFLVPVLALFGFTAVALGLAVATFRWDPDAPLWRKRRGSRPGDGAAVQAG